MDSYQSKALESWYKEGHELQLDPLHPLLGLAGECGELLNLYKKDKFKPDFSWWNCKKCKNDKEFHESQFAHICGNYTPLILDELGDVWYYLRILTWQRDISIQEYLSNVQFSVEDDNLWCLNKLNKLSSMILNDYLKNGRINNSDLLTICGWLMRMLLLLDCSIDKLTELNYQKLNTPSQNGWHSAR